MSDRALFRLLDVVRQRLPARDARVEIGGEPPTGNAVWADLQPGWRVVALLPDDADHDDAKQRLVTLVAAFSGVPKYDMLPALRAAPQRSLDAALSSLCERTGAVGAVLIDVSSPILWGRSHDYMHSDLTVDMLVEANEHIAADGKLAPAGRALLAAGDDEQARHLAAAARAVAIVREATQRPMGKVRQSQPPSELPRHVMENSDDFGFDAHLLADIYYAVLCFEARFSELSASGTLTRAIPMLERLVAALPPIEPPPRGGRVIPLTERR